MAEPANGGNSGSNKNPRQPPKELSMEVRLLLAFLLMGAVMFLWPYLPFFKTAAPPGGKSPETIATAPGGQPGEPPAEATRPPAAAATAQPASETASASATLQESLPNFT